MTKIMVFSEPTLNFGCLRMGAFDSTIGAMFIGVLLAGIMYGASCAQLWLYMSQFPDDSQPIKVIVVFVWVLDTVHQALVSHCVYTYIITHFAQVEYLDHVVWSLIAEVLVNGAIAIVVQSFYIYRIWRVSGRNTVLITPILVLTLGEFGSVLAYTVKAMPLRDFSELKHLRSLSMTVNALAATTDLSIAGWLSYKLYRSRSGFQRSDHIIKKLIVFTVNTGALTSVCAVLSLITITIFPDTFIYICFFFSMGRLYSNSLLATLNARQMLRDIPLVNETHLSLIDIPCTDVAPNRDFNGISIMVDTVEERARDSRSSAKGSSTLSVYTGDSTHTLRPNV